jgi:hypothetical protein
MAERAGGCLLSRAAIPVLEAFSSIVSYEPVLLLLRSDDDAEMVEETGQRAAMRLLLAVMGESGCPFFSGSLPIGVGQPGGENCAVALQRMVRGQHTSRQRDTTGLARRVAAIEARLAPILREARRRCCQDAAVNAVVLLYNWARLALEEEDGPPMVRRTPDAVRVPRKPRGMPGRVRAGRQDAA